MAIKVNLSLDELKKRLCPECQKVMDEYFNELILAELSKHSSEESLKRKSEVTYDR